MRRTISGLKTSAFALTLFFALSLSAPAMAQTKGGPWGFGIMLGDPNALTAKFIADSHVAYDMGLSFSFDRWFLVYGDWLYHVPGAFGRSNDFAARLTPYIGVGGLFIASQWSEAQRRKDRYFETSSSSSVALGIRFPLGLEFRPSQIPVGFFIELTPGMTIVPSTVGFFQGGFGGRFYF